MSSSSSIETIFFDLTSLIEYCSVYFDEQHYAAKAIDEIHEEGGKLVVGNKTKLSLNRRMNNRKRLWNHLINEATEILKDDEKDIQYFKADVLNYSSLQTSMNFNLDDGYLPDIVELKDTLEEMSLEDFRKEIDDARIMGQEQRVEIETVKNFNEYDKARQAPWLLSGTISQYADSEDHKDSIINYAYWCQSNSGPLVVGSKSDVGENKEEVEETIKSNLEQASPEIYTCEDIVSNIAATH